MLGEGTSRLRALSLRPLRQEDPSGLGPRRGSPPSGLSGSEDAPRKPRTCSRVLVSRSVLGRCPFCPWRCRPPEPCTAPCVLGKRCAEGRGPCTPQAGSAASQACPVLGLSRHSPQGPCPPVPQHVKAGRSVGTAFQGACRGPSTGRGAGLQSARHCHTRSAWLHPPTEGVTANSRGDGLWALLSALSFRSPLLLTVLLAPRGQLPASRGPVAPGPSPPPCDGRGGRPLGW